LGGGEVHKSPPGIRPDQAIQSFLARIELFADGSRSSVLRDIYLCVCQGFPRGGKPIEQPLLEPAYRFVRGIEVASLLKHSPTFWAGQDICKYRQIPRLSDHAPRSVFASIEVEK
jgi:hypothetical protein